MTTWATWTGKTAHAVAGRASAGDVAVGGFPTLCGRWAPDPMDGGRQPRIDANLRRCSRCWQIEKARRDEAAA